MREVLFYKTINNKINQVPNYSYNVNVILQYIYDILSIKTLKYSRL